MPSDFIAFQPIPYRKTRQISPGFICFIVPLGWAYLRGALICEVRLSASIYKCQWKHSNFLCNLGNPGCFDAIFELYSKGDSFIHLFDEVTHAVKIISKLRNCCWSKHSKIFILVTLISRWAYLQGGLIRGSYEESVGRWAYLRGGLI